MGKKKKTLQTAQRKGSKEFQDIEYISIHHLKNFRSSKADPCKCLPDREFICICLILCVMCGLYIIHITCEKTKLHR